MSKRYAIKTLIDTEQFRCNEFNGAPSPTQVCQWRPLPSSAPIIVHSYNCSSFIGHTFIISINAREKDFHKLTFLIIHSSDCLLGSILSSLHFMYGLLGFLFFRHLLLLPSCFLKNISNFFFPRLHQGFRNEG